MTLGEPNTEFLRRGFFESYLFNISISSTCQKRIPISNAIDTNSYDFYNIARKMKRSDLLRCIKYIYSANGIAEPEYIIELSIEHADICANNNELINTYREHLNEEELPFLLYLYDTYESLLLAVEYNAHFWEAYDKIAHHIATYRFKIAQNDERNIYSFITFEFPNRLVECIFFIRLFLLNEHFQYNIVEFLDEAIRHGRAACPKVEEIFPEQDNGRRNVSIDRSKESPYKFKYKELEREVAGPDFSFCFCHFLRNMIGAVFYKLKLLKIALYILRPIEENVSGKLFIIQSPFFLSSIIDIFYLNNEHLKIIRAYNDMKILQNYFLGSLSVKIPAVEEESYLSAISEDGCSSKFFNNMSKYSSDNIFKGDDFFTPLKLYILISYEQLKGRSDILEYVISKNTTFRYINKIRLIYIQDLIKRGESNKIENLFSQLQNENNLFTEFVTEQFSKQICTNNYKILYAYYRIYGSEKYLKESIELKSFIDIFIRQYVNNKFYRNTLFGADEEKNFALSYSDCKYFNINIYELKNIKNYTKEFLLSLTRDYRMKIEGDAFYEEENYKEAIEKYLQVKWRPIRKLLKKYLKLR